MIVDAIYVQERTEMKNRIWRSKNNYKVAAVAVEVLFLVVMIFLSIIFYQTQKKRLVSEASSDLAALCFDMENIVVADQGSIDEALLLAASANTLAATAEVCDPGTAKWQSDYGIALEVYDTEGNVIDQSNEVNHGFIWVPQTGGAEDYEWFELDSYFLQSDISEWMEFCQSSQSRYPCRTVIRQMKGYYQNDQFIPSEIEFYDMDQEDRIFVLKNSEASKKDCVVRMDAYLHDGGKEDSDEEGTFYLYIDNTRQEVRSRAWKMLRDKEGNDEPFSVSYEGEGWHTVKMIYALSDTGNEEIPGYALAACIDIRHLMWHSFRVWNSLVETVILCQILLAIFIILFCYVGKKRQQFEEMRDTFINAVAHEMKTPAAVIKNCMEYIEMGTQQEKKEYYRRAAIQETNHLNELLDSMLIYTRVSDISCEVRWETCDLRALMEQIYGHYQSELEQKNVQWEFICEDDCRINADQKLLKIVLDNLISNAVKYCSHGGCIKISMSGAEISVFNTGKSIPEEKLDRIWEPLYRVDGTCSPEEGSSGMGLAICKKIFKIHEFTYGVKNISGGVIFWFYVK